MQSSRYSNVLKHRDFILIDFICLQLCFFISYILVNLPHEFPYLGYYWHQLYIVTGSQILLFLFSNGYSGIMRRKHYDEMVHVLRFTGGMAAISIMYLFAVHGSDNVSRMQFGLTYAMYVVVDTISRILHKQKLYKTRQETKSLVLVTSGQLAKDALKDLCSPDYFKDFFVAGVVLFEADEPDEMYEIPVIPFDDRALEFISHGWVDEVFILQPADIPFPKEFVRDIQGMGLSVSYSMSAMDESLSTLTGLKTICGFKVLTSAIREVPPGQIILKRIMDVVGGLLGCLITGILYLILAPLIKKESPGPVFYSQERIGRNGKIFRMYKFRSMYLDADKHREEMQSQNNISGGLMFKVDDDPRIIGSQKKDKNGKPKGIGNFIRNTSLDEFPQFWNVLKGDMSIVGTRPPLPDEWEKYDPRHRIRMAIKPGVTGLWQVSGRSEITDFEEVVRLDRQYVEGWNILLDIKIILKTIAVVFTGDGAK